MDKEKKRELCARKAKISALRTVGDESCCLLILHHPCSSDLTAEADKFFNCVQVRCKVAHENRLMMSDAVSQAADLFQVVVNSLSLSLN